MHVTPSQYAETFAEIKRSSLSHSTCKLVIFVSCLNIDALCAAKILSILFRKELIQYQLIPVVGYSDLKSHFVNLDLDVHNILLVGCGAMLDLESFFDLDADDYVVPTPETEIKRAAANLNDLRTSEILLTRKIYVIDGHRPWNLDNVFGSSMVVCLDDGLVDLNLTSEKLAYSLLINEEEEGEDDGDDDNGNSEASDTEADESNSDGDISSLPESDSNLLILSQDSPETQSRKRRRQEFRTKRIKRQRRRKRHQHQDVIQSYYNQGTTIITSVSAVVYAFISTIGETSIENLWLAIIGTSSLDPNFPEVYDKLQPLFKDEVMRLGPAPNSGSSGSIAPEKTADSYTLLVEKDYHLFLLRHWTLYDAFFFSSHVNSKLNLWTEDGKKRLHKLFATMGISLAAAQQKWLYMDVRIKKQLPVIFAKYLPKYGLEHIVRDGFIRTYGFTGLLSAMECVELLTALLEADKRVLGVSGNAEPDPQPDAEENELDEDERIRGRIESKEKAWVNNFWSSWDALDVAQSQTASLGTKKLRGYDLLAQGLEHAKVMQEIVFKAGMSLLERKLIKNLRLYRLCVLQDGSIPDLMLFNNPLMLTKLSTWLLDNITELDFANNSRKSLKPLVAASLDVASDTYLVIGLAPKYPRGMGMQARAELARSGPPGTAATLTTRLNTFSVAFQQLANTSGAKVRIDSFDSSVIEIRKDDLPPFLEKLTLSGMI